MFQLLQIPEAADASGVGDRKPFHLSQQPYQFRLNAGSFPLHIHRVDEKFAALAGEPLQELQRHFFLCEFLPAVSDNIIASLPFPAA